MGIGETIVAWVAIAFAGLFVAATQYIESDAYASLRSLLGMREVNATNLCGAKMVARDGDDYPIMSLSFDTFETLYKASPDKFAFCLFHSEYKEGDYPGAVLYDRDKDGVADIRVCMASKEDAKRFISWFREKMAGELSVEEQQTMNSNTNELIRCAEQMQKDLKAHRELTHTQIMDKTKKNSAWRKAAEKRQSQLGL